MFFTFVWMDLPSAEETYETVGWNPKIESFPRSPKAYSDSRPTRELSESEQRRPDADVPGAASR